ncbi:MAG: class I SAM-dependent methyltransferase [Acidimicrobiales bacterium]
MIHKWLHYFPIYERHLSPFRGRAVTMLEIGVSHGGSLQMWRHHLGRRSRIVGFDIEPRVADLAEQGIDVLVGDQSDPVFLDGLVRRYGEFDVVLDDGSHFPEHQITSICHLWPHVAEGGVYIVEDLHSNYWAAYGAGRGQPNTFISWLHERIDDMHAFHSEDAAFQVNEWTRTVNAIHIYDSVAVLEKVERERPVHRRAGRPSFEDIDGINVDEVIDQQHREQLRSLSSPAARLRRLRRDPRCTLRRVLARVRQTR